MAKKLEVVSECTCSSESEKHPCPYSQDMTSGECPEEEDCSCCEACTEKCALDI